MSDKAGKRRPGSAGFENVILSETDRVAVQKHIDRRRSKSSGKYASVIQVSACSCLSISFHLSSFPSTSVAKHSFHHQFRPYRHALNNRNTLSCLYKPLKQHLRDGIFLLNDLSVDTKRLSSTRACLMLQSSWGQSVIQEIALF